MNHSQRYKNALVKSGELNTQINLEYDYLNRYKCDQIPVNMLTNLTNTNINE